LEPDLDASGVGRGFLRRFFRWAGVPEVSSQREATVLAVASGKGGTGKSFLATNLAVALHRAGRRVVVVDCDFGLANAHLLLGANPRGTMLHLLSGAATVQHVLARTAFGPALVAGGSGLTSLAELGARHMQALARALHWLAGQHDVVLLDCSAGLSPQAMITVLAAQHVVIVTNPEIAALTDAYALIKCIARQCERPELHVVVNRVTRPGLGHATFERLAAVSRRFAGAEIHYAGEVPEDPAVAHRRLGQPPLLVRLPECPTARAILSAMATLETRTGGFVTKPAAGHGVAARMAAQIRRW